MRALRVLALALVPLVSTNPLAAADETPAKSKIVAVDLFKNGLAVVKRETTLGKAGVYVLDDVPTPVHGTFYIDSTGTVDVSVQTRDVEVPANETAPGALQDDLAGKKVTVHFRGANRPPVSGTMMKFKPAKGEETAANRFYVLQTAKGRAYVDPADVSAVESDDAGTTVTRRKPRLVFTLKDTDKPQTVVSVRYIATGMSWAPSYRIDITDPKKLALEQHAVVKNELADLAGAEVRLISGYPSVEYSHVRSPLAPRTSLASFFGELGGGRHREIDALSNSIVSQQAISLNNYRVHNVALGATPTGEGVDLHYQSIGKRTLAEGDALGTTVAKGTADYERIVEWLIPDSRDTYGRHSDGTGDGEAWDALKFKNPLSFPMTTGPATVTANGKFNGQRTSYWVNAGEETVLRVEKALSVRTRASENEKVERDGSGREVIWVGGRQYRRTTVEGEIAVSNNRKEAVSLVIRRRFSGELVTAEGAPRTALREEGVYSVNKRQELIWTVPLKGGEEKKIKYSYTVLAMN